LIKLKYVNNASALQQQNSSMRHTVPICVLQYTRVKGQGVIAFVPIIHEIHFREPPPTR